jgi:hypothetical protein
MTEARVAAAAQRPFVGVVVEGHGEYEAYPSLVNRLVGTSGVHVPCLNARGVGNVLERVERLLDDIVLAHKPMSVLVALDLTDALDVTKWKTCAALRRDLLSRCQRWLRGKAGDHRFMPLPARVDVIIQVPAFESWVIADTEGLARHHCFPDTIGATVWRDVDSEVPNPCAWLARVQTERFDSKNPRMVKQVLSGCSVRTLCKEVEAAYAAWEHEALGVRGDLGKE